MNQRLRDAIPSEVQIPMPNLRTNEEDALACSQLVSEVASALKTHADSRPLAAEEDESPPGVTRIKP